MFELFGNETEHEAAIKRVMNIQEEMIDNLYRITELETEIKNLRKETNMLDEALEYWKLEVAKYYNSTNLAADLSGATLATKEVIKKKKPTTK